MKKPQEAPAPAPRIEVSGQQAMNLIAILKKTQLVGEEAPLIMDLAHTLQGIINQEQEDQKQQLIKEALAAAK